MSYSLSILMCRVTVYFFPWKLANCWPMGVAEGKELWFLCFTFLCPFWAAGSLQLCNCRGRLLYLCTLMALLVLLYYILYSEPAETQGFICDCPYLCTTIYICAQQVSEPSQTRTEAFCIHLFSEAVTASRRGCSESGQHTWGQSGPQYWQMFLFLGIQSSLAPKGTERPYNKLRVHVFFFLKVIFHEASSCSSEMKTELTYLTKQYLAPIQ